VNRIIVVIFLCIAGCGISMAQVSGTMVAPDSSVIMSVSRVNGEIFIKMDFSKDFQCAKVSIERKPEFDTEFSQCRLFSFNEVKENNYHVVKKDNYPYHNSAVVSYRLKLIFSDGGERMYPSVSLPAAGH
jgi:hypothetical protein